MSVASRPTAGWFEKKKSERVAIAIARAAVARDRARTFADDRRGVRQRVQLRGRVDVDVRVPHVVDPDRQRERRRGIDAHGDDDDGSVQIDAPAGPRISDAASAARPRGRVRSRPAFAARDAARRGRIARSRQRPARADVTTTTRRASSRRRDVAIERDVYR